MVCSSSHRGFTLLELLIVLAVMGISASVVGPQMWQTYSKAQEKQVLQSLAIALQAMRQNAFHLGKATTLPAISSPSMPLPKAMPPLPAGWILENSTALRFLPNGVTNGGTIQLHAPSGNRWQLTLRPLDARVRIHRL